MNIRPTLCFNARFLTQPLTGVQRYSYELLNEIDKMVSPGEIEALCPSGDRMPVSWNNINLHVCGQFRGNLWEQIDLPLAARGKLLFSPSNIGPYLHPNQVVTIHDANVFAYPDAYSRAFRLKYQITFKQLAKTARLILTDSHFSKSELVHYAGMKPDRIEVIPLGREHFERIQPDFSVIRKNNLEKKPFLITVGSNSPHKNFSGLYDVIKKIDPEDYELVVVGGTFGKVFQQEESLSDIPACIHRLGYVSDKELKALYHNATAFILPTKYEGFGFPVLEAMTCGCPVTCSKVASLPEVGGDAVLYFDPYQPEDMAAKICEIMSSEELRQDLINRGNDQKQKFSWKETARRTWSILHSFL